MKDAQTTTQSGKIQYSYIKHGQKIVVNRDTLIEAVREAVEDALAGNCAFVAITGNGFKIQSIGAVEDYLKEYEASELFKEALAAKTLEGKDEVIRRLAKHFQVLIA